MNSKTKNDNTSDPILTEDVVRPRQSEGRCYVCSFPEHCPYECVAYKSSTAFLFCSCIYHHEMRLERYRQNGIEEDEPIFVRAIEKLNRIISHNALQAELEGRVQKRKLHDQNKANATSQLGPREFTLTYSPSWGWDDDEARATMSAAIERLTRIYKQEIIEFHAVGEFGHDGRPHVHGWYHLVGGRKITDKNFKRVYPKWNPKRKLGKGFEGGHHETIKRISDFAGYAEKHLDEAWMNHHITNANAVASQEAPPGILGEDLRPQAEGDSSSDSEAE